MHGLAQEQLLGPGDLLLIKPGLPHACRALPGHDEAWAYTMLFVDPAWLATLQGGRVFQPLAASLLREPLLVQGLRRQAIAKPRARPCSAAARRVSRFTGPGEIEAASAKPAMDSHGETSGVVMAGSLGRPAAAVLNEITAR